MDPEPVGATRSSQSIIEMVSTHHLAQVNTFSNARGVFLDLIFSSQLLYVVTVPDSLFPVQNDHPAIGTSVTFEVYSRHIGGQI